MQTRTKAELEEEISYLSHRVAALEGAITAYRYALEQVSAPPPAPVHPYEVWPGLGHMQWYPVPPVSTTPS